LNYCEYKLAYIEFYKTWLDEYISEDNLASFEAGYGLVLSRDLALLDEWDYWTMDVDWLDRDDLIDYIEEDVLFCDMVLGAGGAAGW